MTDLIATYAGPAAVVFVGFWFGTALLSFKSLYDDEPNRRIRGAVRAWRHLRRGIHRAGRSRR